MWKSVLAGTTALAIVGASAVFAQQRTDAPQPQRWQPSQEDVQAFSAARIAALKAGLMLNADQEKNWPAFEQALKEVAKVRAERRAARRSAQPTNNDPTERLRRRADAMSSMGAALKQLADAQAPLYNSLDEAQKRRFALLSQRTRPHAGHRHHHRRADRGGFEGRGHHHFDRRGDAGPHGHGERQAWRGRHQDRDRSEPAPGGGAAPASPDRGGAQQPSGQGEKM